MQIVSKEQWLDLLLRGDLAINTTRTWDTVRELVSSGFPGPIGIRYKEPDKIRQRGYQMVEVPNRVVQLIASGLKINLMYFHEWPPSGTLRLNGQMTTDPSLRTEFGEPFVNLTYSRSDGSVWNDPHYAEGESATQLIVDLAGAKEYYALLDLAQRFPRDQLTGIQPCVVEFTIHSIPTGRLQRHTVIWEIRNY